MTTIFSLLIGAVLGTRYKVFCLPPVILAAALFIAALDHLHEVPPGSTALTALAAGVGLQIGYLAGAMIHALLFASPADPVSAAAGARDRSASMS